MDENLHNIEDLFYSALDDNTEEAPSANVWQGIDKQLDKDNIIIIKRKYLELKRVVVLLVLLLGIALYQLNTTQNNSEQRNNTISKSKPGSKAGEPSNIKDDVKKTSAIVVATENTITNSKNDSKPMYDSTVHSIFVAKNDENYLVKRHGSVNATQNKNSSWRPDYKIEIENKKVSEKEQALVQHGDKQDDSEIPPLHKLGTVPVENTKLQLTHSIETNQLLKIIASSEIKNISQSNSTIKKKTPSGKLSLTPFFSPELVGYHLEDDKPENQENAKEIESGEKHEFSYMLGVLVDYKLNKHWGIQSGITYANTDITVQPKTLYAQPDNTGSVKYRINTSSGYGYVLPSFSTNPAIGDSLYAFTSTHSLQYVAVPVALTYHIRAGKKLALVPLAGVSTNILIRAKLETSVENGIDNSTEAVDNLQGLKKVYFSGLASIGIEYRLSAKTVMTFAPVLRFALNSINKDASVKSYPMSSGFTIGVKTGL
ncbi:MAG: hypothetical protein JWQ09_2052 [Segetibacter sp.]|nr:hypothetical protein [Segetibacter sp.]